MKNMTHFRKLVFLCTLFLSFYQLQAQVLNSRFIQATEKSGSSLKGSIQYQDKLIIATVTSEANKEASKPEIFMVDSALNIVWKLSTTDTFYFQTTDISSVFMGQDNYLYAWFTTALVSSKNHYLLKIDPSNGTILWRTRTSTLLNESAVAPLDSSHIIMMTMNSSFKIFNTSDGSLQRSDTLIFTSRIYSTPILMVPDSGTILYVGVEDSLYKISLDTVPQVRWGASYKGSNQVRLLTRLYLDKDHYVYASATRSPDAFTNISCTLRINGTNGALENIVQYSGPLVTRIVKSDSFTVYCSTKYTLSPPFYPLTTIYGTKVNNFSGDTVWDVIHTIADNGHGGSVSGNAYIQDIETDAAGDIYIAGSVGGQFLYLKLNGASGDLIYHNVISTDSSGAFSTSTAYRVDLLGSSVVCTGVCTNAASSFENVYGVLIDPLTGDVQKSSVMAPDVVMASSVLKILRHKSGFISLQQYGNNIQVEYVDSNLTGIWSRVIPARTNRILRTYDISLSDSDIYVTALSESSGFTDTLKIFRLGASDGTLRGNFGVYMGVYSNNVTPMDIVPFSSGSALVFYRRHDGMHNYFYSVKINQDSLSAPLNLTPDGSSSISTHAVKKGNSALFHLKDPWRGYLKSVDFSTHTLSTTDTPTYVYNPVSAMLLEGDTLYMLNGSAIKYNLNTKKVIWGRSVNASLMKRCRTQLIVAGKEDDYLNDKHSIRITSIDADSGTVKWSYLYKYNNRPFILNDLEVNEATGRIMLTGSVYLPNFSAISSSLVVFYCMLDSNGVLIDEYVPEGMRILDDGGNCLLSFNDRIYMGGKYNRYAGSYEGFIYEMDINHYLPISNFNLKLPITNYRYAAKLNNSLSFTWSGAFSAVRYKLVIDTPSGNFTSPLFYSTPANPKDSAFTLSYASIDSLLNGLNIGYGDSTMLKWTVIAYNIHNDSLLCSPFMIKMIRYPKVSKVILSNPVQDTSILTRSSDLSRVWFTWQKSKNAKLYKFHLAGPSATVLYSTFPGATGADTSISFSNSYLDNLGVVLGINPGDSVVIKWFVFAYNNAGDTSISDTFRIHIKRVHKAGVFTILSPVNNSRVLTAPDDTTKQQFIWQRSEHAIGYKLTIDIPTGSFTPGVIVIPSNGADTLLEVRKSYLDSLINERGVPKGDSITLKWAVLAYTVYNDSTFSSFYRNIKFVRDKALLPFALVAPATNTRIITTDDDYTSNQFIWKTSKKATRYRLVFDYPSGNFSSTLFSISINRMDTNLYLTNHFLDSLLNNEGIIPGDSITLKWSCIAYNAFNDSLMASSSLAIKFVRLKGISPFSLVAPVTGTRIATATNNPALLTFTWRKTTKAVKYTFMFDQSFGVFNPGLFKAPVHSTDTSLDFSISYLDSFLNNLNVSIGDSVSLLWNIRAYSSAGDSLMGSTSFIIKFVREKPLVPFSLAKPDDHALLITMENNTQPVSFTWKSARALNYYFFLSDKNGQFGSLSYRWIADNNGTDTTKTFTSHELDSIVKEMGVVTGDSASLKWRVYGYYGLDSLKAITDFNVTIKRDLHSSVSEHIGYTHHYFVYPNPFTTGFTITSPDKNTYLYSVFDLHGKEVLTGSFSGTTYIDMQLMESGFYTLVIVSENKERSNYPFKIIKY